MSPYIASLVGVLIGFTWNWTMNSLVIWPKERAAQLVIDADDPDLRPA